MSWRSLLVVALVAGLSSSARASDLGPDGRVHFSANALFKLDFEDATATAAVLQKMTTTTYSYAYTQMSAADVMPLLATSGAALEGATSFHATATNLGFAIVDTTTFASLVGKRISVSFWGRAEGMAPSLTVTYGNAADLLSEAPVAWATIPALRTGRETSDGWVEYATGPIDGSVLDHPIHDLTLSAYVATQYGTEVLLNASSVDTSQAMSVDAIEIVPAAGAVSTGTCTLATADTDCAAGGECFFGHCVDGAAVWNPVPPLAAQQQIVARLEHWILHFLGDRHALASLPANWVATTSALASPTATAHSFWSGLNAQVVAVRDTHTSLGSPFSHLYTPFFPRPYSNSGTLDVCFGPTLDDLEGNQMAFVVWRLGSSATASLKVGDVVTAIDGMDPKTWVELAFAQYADSLPIDPRADWAPASRQLGMLLAQRASTLQVSRCSGGTCVAQPPIDVPTISLSQLGNGKYNLGSLACSTRFTDLVPGARSDQYGGDLLLSKALDASTVGIEFDGFSPSDDSTWADALDAAFTPPHAQMIVDARDGHGGENDLGKYMMQKFRGTDVPAVLALSARGTFDDPDPPSLTSFNWAPCEMYGSTWQCSTADIFVYYPTSAAAPGEASKVAWLNTDDVSNNDMVPLLLQGRANLQIFAPFPTYGAFGSDVSLTPFLPSWSAGSIAASDGRYGATIEAAEAQPSCRSGVGVVPDQVVTQTLSDVLAGQDTILNAAKTWLGQ